MFSNPTLLAPFPFACVVLVLQSARKRGGEVHYKGGDRISNEPPPSSHSLTYH